MILNKIPTNLGATATLAFLSRVVVSEYQPRERASTVARILLALHDRLKHNIALRAIAADLLAGYQHLAVQPTCSVFSEHRAASYTELARLLAATGVTPCDDLYGAVAIWEAWVSSMRGFGRRDLDGVLRELTEELKMLRSVSGG